MRKSLPLAAVLLVAFALVGCRNKPPKVPIRPIGPDGVGPGDTVTYRTVSTDPNRDDIRYIYDWGTPTAAETTALNQSGDTVGLAHAWSDTGWYPVQVRAIDENENYSPAWSDTHLVHVRIGVPNAPDKPTGPDSGWVRVWHKFSTRATDPDGDSVRIVFYWDDGMVSLPIPAASGQAVTDSVKYSTRGFKRIRATATDPDGLVSDTSEAKEFLSLQTNTKPFVPFLAGPARGIANGPYYRFYATSNDPENDRVQYRFFIGSDTSHGWTPFQSSGVRGVDSFRFAALGTYQLRAIARDSLGLVSDTSLARTFQVVDEGTIIWSLAGGLAGEEFVSSPALGPITSLNELRPGVIVGSLEGYLWGIDAYQAETLYRTPSLSADPSGYSSSPAIGADGRVYIGCDDGRFIAHSSDGQQKWVFPDAATGDDANATAVVDGSALYIGGEDRYLRRLRDDGATRTHIWGFYLGEDVNSSPAMMPGGNLVVCDDSGYVSCLDQDGNRLWRHYSGAGITSSPAVGPDGTVYLGTDQGQLLAVKDGALVWWDSMPGQLNDVNSSPVLDAAGNVYFGSDNGNLYKYSPTGSRLLEVLLSTASASATPLLCQDGVIYAATEDDRLHAVNADGSIRWTVALTPLDGSGRGGARRLSLTLASSPVVDQYGIIYIGATNGIFAIAGRAAGTLMNSAWPMFHRDVKHTGKY